MINLTANKKRIIIEITILILIFIVAGFFLYKVYYAKTIIDEDLFNEYKLKELEADKKFNKLNKDFFDDKKYKDLKDSKVEKIKIEDLEIGKENPFENPKDLEETNPQ